MLLRHKLIGPETLNICDSTNINGPSCIELPQIIDSPLGRYYLYFAHHRGSHIRLAYADDPKGPWTIYQGGVLHLDQLPQCRDHIASPDVIVDIKSGEIRMYFHGVDTKSGNQLTYFASSPDGLHFTALPTPVAPSYLRVVQWRDAWIGMSKGGQVLLSSDGKTPFRALQTPSFPMSGRLANEPGDIRHVAIDLHEDRLWVFFSRIADAPEHIRLGYIDLLRPLEHWRVEASIELLKPVMEWEGAHFPAMPSRSGSASPAENALRDPAILKTESSRWLFYSIAGEAGIACVMLPEYTQNFIEQPKLLHWQRDDEARVADKQLRERLHQLEHPGALERRLAELDQSGPRQRIFLMGCGRSGTWLLTALMSCFQNAVVITRELPVEAFGLVESAQKNIILKRAYNSYKHVNAIPDAVGIIFIVRNPFDVLTSHNPMTGRRYHISPDRWMGEMQALKQVLESGRTNVLVVRYEDLVNNAEAVLSQIARKFSLAQATDAASALAGVSLPQEAQLAMHGPRPIDQQSVMRHRRDPEALNYLRQIIPLLDGMLPWMAQQFRYESSL